METLDDSNGSHKVDDEKKDEAEMETVKLDIGTDNNGGFETEKPALSDEDEEHSKWDIPECCRRSAIVQRITEYQTLGVIVLVFLFMIVFILVSLLFFGGSRPPTNAPIYNGKYVKAVTSCGNVEGMLEEGVFAFRGIPYALPPVDELRWKPPKAFDLNTCWNDTFRAHNSSAHCWQRYNNASVNGAEDCLTLDVFTPYVRYHSPLPVVVLVGSDTLAGGSPGQAVASPRIARNKELVLVRPNFRLGPLGFLAARPLTTATHPPTSGNYGLHDLIAALKWVQLNAEHFGGDRQQVTVLAHRGGATLVAALTAIRKPEKLFARAWLSSGSAVFPDEPLMDSENRNRQYLEKLKCDHYGSLKCLLDQDMEELTDQVPLEWWYKAAELPTAEENMTAVHQWLVTDGKIIKEHPSHVWAKEPLKIQLVFGTTAHAEASLDLKRKSAEWNVEDVALMVRSSVLSGLGLAEEALRRYNTTYPGLAAMVSDIRTVCPLLTVAKQIQGAGFYVVTQTHDDDMVDPDADIKAILGHYPTRTPEERRYVTSIQQMFYRYVAHGTFDTIPSDASQNRLIMLGQDPLPAIEYPNCDYWVSKDIVPKYARVH
ncbi:neurotactin-like [Nilaparvata lugens]|uniref:neurotactin-like n=1 Tax=Nilaparvata lugens TaxID=108931 RepID=UPI00193D21A4|nr:neurotactin-like [Nilaparvata lugens]